MSKIFITGDTHCDMDINKLNTTNFPEQKSLTKDDYVIICGDFGGVWYGDKKSPKEVLDKYEIPKQLLKEWGKDNYILNWHNDKNYTTLFIDGNHENHKLLNCYPVEEWNGGFVHRIRPNVIHLMRGQIYTINNKKFFVMGGASSHDKEYRKTDISWWEEELPTMKEFDLALANLDKHNWQVDYVLTHDCGDNIQYRIAPYFQHDILSNFLFTIDKDLTFEKWFFGHYHIDREIDDKHIALYQNIIEL